MRRLVNKRLLHKTIIFKYKLFLHKLCICQLLHQYCQLHTMCMLFSKGFENIVATIRLLRYKRMYLPLCKGADTTFHIYRGTNWCSVDSFLVVNLFKWSWPHGSTIIAAIAKCCKKIQQSSIIISMKISDMLYVRYCPLCVSDKAISRRKFSQTMPSLA